MALDDAALLSMLTPEVRAYIENRRAANVPPLAQRSVTEARQYMRSTQNADLSRYSIIAERHLAGTVPIHIFRPSGLKGTLPAILYLHGGGWVLGDADTHARLARELAARTDAAVVFVDYQRAPEVIFPQPLEDCYYALVWLTKNSGSLQIDPERLAIAGDSAGGNLATAVTMLALRRGGPRVRLQALLYPIVDCDSNTSSYRDFGRGLNLDSAGMAWFWNHCVPDADQRLDPLASPLRAATGELTQLPPALIITAECDVLRDEGEAYARKLAQAGVPLSAARFVGTLHGFMLIDELAGSLQALAAMDMLCRHLHRALQVSESTNRVTA